MPQSTNERNQRNKENAQHSTGPRSAKGKARSSQNSTRHGIYAKAALLPIEDLEQYRQFVDDIVDDLNPSGATQIELATLIADDYWRMRRFRVMETNQLMRVSKFVPERDTPEQEGRDLAAGFDWDCRENESIIKLGRHEQRVANTLLKMTAQLERMQRRAEQEAQQEEPIPEAAPAPIEPDDPTGFVPDNPPTTPETPENAAETTEIPTEETSSTPCDTEKETN